MKEYIENLRSLCYEAAEGKLTGKRMEALSAEIEGAFGNLPKYGVPVRRALDSGNWNMIAGAVMACMEMTLKADGTSVMQIAQNSTNLNVEVTISQTIKKLDRCGLDKEEMKAIKAAIADLEAAKGDRPETICEKASKLLDLAKKGADAAKAVAPFVAQALSSIA